MVHKIEQIIEFNIDIPFLDADDFGDKIISVFKNNPFFNEYCEGKFISESRSNKYSKFILSIEFPKEQLPKIKKALNYMKRRGYECDLKLK